MIKTLKGKVIAGTVAVTLVAGSGVAFGASDAGVKIRAWYDGQFNTASSNVNTSYGEQKNLGIGDFKGSVATLKSGAKESIEGNAGEQIENKSGNINDQKQTYIDAIAGEKAAIEGQIDSQFNTLFENAKKDFNKSANEEVLRAGAGVTFETTKIATDAYNNVRSELKKSSDNAVSELETAIKNAKDSLQSQLDSKQLETTEDIQAAINKKVEEITKTITKLTNSLVTLQNGIISKEAQRLENKALNEMESLVTGI